MQKNIICYIHTWQNTLNEIMCVEKKYWTVLWDIIGEFCSNFLTFGSTKRCIWSHVFSKCHKSATEEIGCLKYFLSQQLVWARKDWRTSCKQWNPWSIVANKFERKWKFLMVKLELFFFFDFKTRRSFKRKSSIWS